MICALHVSICPIASGKNIRPDPYGFARSLKTCPARPRQRLMLKKKSQIKKKNLVMHLRDYAAIVVIGTPVHCINPVAVSGIAKSSVDMIMAINTIK